MNPCVYKYLHAPPGSADVVRASCRKQRRRWRVQSKACTVMEYKAPFFITCRENALERSANTRPDAQLAQCVCSHWWSLFDSTAFNTHALTLAATQWKEAEREKNWEGEKWCKEWTMTWIQRGTADMVDLFQPLRTLESAQIRDSLLQTHGGKCCQVLSNVQMWFTK